MIGVPKIGDPIWIFDDNQRVYSKPDGSKTNAPIWHGHWKRRVITAETSRSWLLDGSENAKKSSRVRVEKNHQKTFTSPCFSREEIDQRFSALLTASKVRDAIFRNADPNMILRLAGMLGVTVLHGEPGETIDEYVSRLRLLRQQGPQ